MITRLKLAPYTIQVNYDKDACNAGGVTGAYMADSGVIIIEPGNALHIEQETLLHEALHACWAQAGLKIEYPDDKKTSVGEKIVQALTPRLLSLIRENPDLITYLQGDR